MTFSIIWFLADFLGPRLKILSQMLAIFSLASMFIWPTYRMVKNIRQRGRLPDMKSKRVYVTLTVFAGLVACFFLLPLPVSKVRETGLVSVQPEHSLAVGLAEPGHLVAVLAKEGNVLRKGDRIAEFDSRDLRDLIAQAEAKRNEQNQLASSLRQQITRLKGDRTAEQRMRLEVSDAEKNADSYAKEVQMLKERLTNLQYQVAPRDGVVMGLPKQSDLGKLFDRNFTQNQPICTVGDPNKLMIRVPVSPLDYRLLQEDLPAGATLPVSVYVDGRTDHEFAGVVRRLPESNAKQVPVPLTQRGGGPLAVKQSGEEGQEVTPVAQVYLVDVEVTDPDSSIRPGTLVSVKVHCQWRTCAWWVGRKLAEAMDIGLY